MFKLNSNFNQIKCPLVENGVNNCNRSYCQFNHDLNLKNIEEFSIESIILKYFPLVDNSIQQKNLIDKQNATTSKQIKSINKSGMPN